MAEPASPPDENAARTGKKWGRLRERLFSRERSYSDASEEGESSADAVAAFLGPGASSQASNKQKLVPRLDVDAAKSTRFGNGAAEPVLVAFKYMKPPRREGLRVAFVVTAPEIIGEGGEESEVPVIEVAKARAQQLRSTQSQPLVPKVQVPQYARRPSGSGVPLSAIDMPIQRKPVGSGNTPSPQPSAPLSAPPLASTVHPDDRLESAQETRRLSQMDTASVQDLRKMREDEGSALRSAVRLRASSNPDEAGSLQANELSQSLQLPQSRASDETEIPEPEQIVEDTGINPDLEPGFHGIASLRPPPLYIAPQISPPQSAGRDSLRENFKSNTPSPDYSAHLRIDQNAAPKRSFAQHMRQSSNQSAASSTESLSMYEQKPREDFVESSSNPVTGSGLSLVPPKRQSGFSPVGVSKDIPKSALPADTPVAQPEDDAPAAADSLAEFSTLVAHWKRMFQLSVEAERSGSAVSAIEWLRAALWWFLKGRNGLEEYVRTTRNSSSDGSRVASPQLPRALIQDYVNLAKALWIITDVVPPYLDAGVVSPVPKSASVEDQSLIRAVLEDLNRSFRSLTLSMARRNLFPPAELLISGMDTSTWVTYPTFPLDNMWILSGTTYTSLDDFARSHDPVLSMPLGDMPSMFCYGRSFVLCKVFTDDQETSQNYPCLLSMLRATTSLEPRIMVASQSPMINVLVCANNSFGPSWEHVRWDHDQSSLRVKLPQKLRMRLVFRPSDFEALRDFVEKTRRASSALEALKDEEPRHELFLTSLRYEIHTRQSQDSRNETFRSCKARLFQNLQDKSSKSSRQSSHRLAVSTSPKSRNLRSVSIEILMRIPVEYDYLRDNAGQPALRVRLNEEDRFREIYMSFQDHTSRDEFVHRLTGLEPGPGEVPDARLPLKSVTFRVEHENSAEAFAGTSATTLPWNTVQTLQRASDTPDTPQAPKSFLVVVSGKDGSLVSHMSRGFGDIMVRLSCQGDATLHVLNAPAHDFQAGVRTDAAHPDMFPMVRRLCEWKHAYSTVDSYSFESMQQLHTFQLAVMGCHVLFDGVARTFDIAKRRMVVSLPKHHAAAQVRIQIVEKSGLVHFLAFFEDYALAEALTFKLKTTDVFERHAGKGGGFAVKLVDAKFSLPAGRGEEVTKPGYVCIDSQEVPLEHDDIIVSFEDEADRERFIEALPATATGPRKFTLKRRI